MSIDTHTKRETQRDTYKERNTERHTYKERNTERSRAVNQRLTIDRVFSGRAATGGGATSRSPSSDAAAATGEDDLHAFYNHYTHS